MEVSDDKPTAADRSAGTQPGCRCTAHCEHVHGDQAEDAETRELFRLRDRLEEYRREVERRDEYLRGADADLKEARAELERLRGVVRLQQSDAVRHRKERDDAMAMWNGLRAQVATLAAERDRQRVALTNLIAAAEWLLDDCETSDMRQCAVDALAAARIAKGAT